MEALPGRVWEGKAYLLKAVRTVFTSCKEEVEKGRVDAPVSVEMASAVLKLNFILAVVSHTVGSAVVLCSLML